MTTPKEHILGIRVEDRYDEAQEVQKVLTHYGCSIRTRLGLHKAQNDNCDHSGIILLQLIPGEKHISQLTEALGKIDGVEVKEMKF